MKVKCPSCKALHDSQTSVDGEERLPSPGNVSICFTCGDPSIFDEALELRLPTVAETERIVSDQSVVVTMRLIKMLRSEM